MKFTFGICSNPTSEYELNNLLKVIVSIRELQIPEYEILLCGPFDETYNDGILRVIYFNENIKKGWITKKKNCISEEANFENIVLCHDYFGFNADWYTGWLKFGNDFEVANNVILNLEGTRHSDWTIDPYKVWKEYPEWDWKMWDLNLPYETKGLTKIQYISGGYWVAKKQFMRDNLLDISLCWGEKEDLEWSYRVREKTEFKFNRYSTVQIMKPGKWAPKIIDPIVLEIVKRANEL